jgi:tRNA threonylcarbamoyladenosine biosynthesis protein TsaE
LEEDIPSPTFTMIQEHRGRLPLYHIDLYRLEELGLDDMGMREYLFSSAVAAVEWFERLREAPELEFLSVRIEYTGVSTRRLEFRAIGARHTALVSKLKHRFA